MRNTSVRSLLLCVAIAASVALNGCGAIVTTSVEDAMARARQDMRPQVEAGLKQAGVLTVGLLAGSEPPYVMTADGRLGGMDVEVAGALADELGLRASFVSVADPAAALAGTCDVVMSVGADASGVSVLGAYGSAGIAFFRKGPAGVATGADLADRSVGLQEGSTSQQRLRRTTLGMAETPFDSLNKAFDALDAGQVEYVLCPVSMGAYLTLLHPSVVFCGMLEAPSARGVGVSAQEGEVPAAVRAAFGRIEANGVLAEARRRSLGELPQLTPESQVAGVTIL